MADLKYYDVILKPLMTEKSMSMLEEQSYAFYVHPDATKTQIKEAVEKLFSGTKVASVNTMNKHAKKRQRRGFAPGHTAKRKKAIVKLAPGSNAIEVFEGL
jgi:large subunit ribosomal protein L23